MIFKIDFQKGDEYTRQLEVFAEDILIRMGSPVSTFGFGSSLAIATRQEDNGTYCTVASAYNGRYQGPTRINVTLDMLINGECYQ